MTTGFKVYRVKNDPRGVGLYGQLSGPVSGMRLLVEYVDAVGDLYRLSLDSVTSAEAARERLHKIAGERGIPAERVHLVAIGPDA